jgi:probable F420-dependent oxidoreductase
MVARPFRFGLELHAATEGRSWADTVREVEALGYSTLFVPDHFVEHDLAPTVALAHAAAVTDRLRVGTFVLGNDYKHPVVCAREMASLDLLSDGRLELGIGAGWMTADYEKAGIPLDRPAGIARGVGHDREGCRRRSLRSTGSTTGSPISTGWPVQRPCRFSSAGRPELPALAAGADRQDQRTCARATAARVIAQSLTPAETDKKIGWVPRLRRAIRRPRDASLIGFVYIKDNAADVLEGIAGAFGISADEARLAPPCLVGRSVDDVVESLEERRDRWQFSYHVIDDDAIDVFAPIVARLTGK